MDVVLIPGFWLTASMWDPVLPALEQAGHRTHPLTLPGKESPGADRSQITLADHVAAVVDIVDRLAPDPVALVGHSGGGAVAHAVADARPDRIARIVYVASEPLGDGHVINDGFPSEHGEVPLPDWSAFDDDMLTDLDDERRAAFRAMAVPEPLHVAADPQRLSDERRYDVPITVIACEYPSAAIRQWITDGHPLAAELGRVRDVQYVDLPTGHWPHLTRPRELADVLVAALGPA
jgi:pimeloyl-ACP methyl ester carboxylesterase